MRARASASTGSVPRACHAGTSAYTLRETAASALRDPAEDEVRHTLATIACGLESADAEAVALVSSTPLILGFSSLCKKGPGVASGPRGGRDPG